MRENAGSAHRPEVRPDAQAPEVPPELVRCLASRAGSGRGVTSYDVRIYAIETRKRQTTRYRVRWTVSGKRFGETFATKGLAESYRAALITAARHGEAFSTGTGLPESLERERRDVSFYAHCLEFAGVVWPMISAKSRASIVESLIRAIPMVVRPDRAAPPIHTLVPSHALPLSGARPAAAPKARVRGPARAPIRPRRRGTKSSPAPVRRAARR